MKPFQHPSNNDVLAPPSGVSSAECRPLPITRIWFDMPNGGHQPGVISYWQPTPEELALLNAGRPLYLSFVGLTHPPVALGVQGDANL